MPRSSSTTFASGGAPSDPGSPEECLTAAERAALLAVARDAVRAAVCGTQPLPLPAHLPARLKAPAGAFVSLHAHAELRGCVGSIDSDDPLAVTVARVAAAAATRDPRFPPVAAAELPALHLEVSVLSALRQTSAGEIEPAHHGVEIQLHRQRAVLLPQVAATLRWDRPTLLAHLCEKAGLPPDTWRHPDAVLRSFTVIVVAGPLEGQ